jgi:hypothetical protein
MGLDAPNLGFRTQKPVALRCCVVQETRLDTARIRAARTVIDPIFLDTPLTAAKRWNAFSGAR